MGWLDTWKNDISRMVSTRIGPMTNSGVVWVSIASLT
jgi:hypothetical protein